MRRITITLLPLLAAGCATAANDAAVALCEGARHCHVTDTTPAYGPAQQRVIETSGDGAP